MFYNQFKTVLLLATLSAGLLFIGGLLGGTSGIIMALMLSFIMNGIAYFAGDKIILNMHKAKPLDRQHYKDIYATIEELTNLMHIPQPKVWLIESKMANAFATGRNPANASIAVTTGILEILNKKELRGVLAHELSHIKNRDTLIATIAATLATAIGYAARMFQFGMYNRNNERSGTNALSALVIAIIMPLAAVLIQLALSRTREYKADETGAYSCQDPLALASALEKLHNHISYASMDSNDTAKATTAPLFIMHPFTGKNWTVLFSTHPPIGARIAHLHQIYNKMF